MIFDKHRFEVWTQAQHPYKHSLSDFAFTNPALPGVTNIEAALNWFTKVLYPTTKAAVANPAALPLVGNTLNDYRVVTDDGDGKQAGYRWEQREGDVSPQWYKVFDFDWSTDSILAEFTNITQDLYVYQDGKSDLDAAGVPITGTFAGQTINGGNTAGQNLTLKANSGDGTGPRTGFVQTDDTVRPTTDDLLSIGTLTHRFLDGHFSNALYVDTLAFNAGSILDSSGQISFGDENLVTTGNVTSAIGYFSASAEIGPLAGSALILAPGSITDESGAISFGNENLSTTGTISAATGSQLANITFSTDSINSSGGAIGFGSNNLSTTGTLQAGDTTATRIDADNIRLDGNTISITNTNGNLTVQANGTGIINLASNTTSLDITATGDIAATGFVEGGNLRLTGNALTSQDTDGNIELTPDGTGEVVSSANFLPSANNTLDLGASAAAWKDLYLDGNVSDGTLSIAIATILSLRDILVGVSSGMAIFYDGTKWVASLPDTEITHDDLSGLTTGDAGHTQFALLAGRSGGQTLQGGTAASENLVLESTAHATKGSVLTKDSFRAFTDASFSGGWQGADIGGASNYFRDLYTKGELRGARLENFTAGTLPSASANNVGRVVWTTDASKIYVDTGGTWKAISVGKYVSDTSWDGTATTQDFTVSASVSDARNALWAIHDNANDFDRIYCSIKAISATQVRVTVAPALPAGSYRLIGIE